MSFLQTLRLAWQTQIHGEGGHCPVCLRFCKVYSRDLNQTMVTGLRWLYECGHTNLMGGEWVNVPKRAPRWLVRSNQHPTLRWWDLVESRGNGTGGKSEGVWRVTTKGEQFVLGKIAVSLTAHTYNGVVLSHSGPQVKIGSILSAFDYRAMMEKTYAEVA